MSIISYQIGTAGEVNVNPRMCFFVVTDNLATVTTAGYLNNQALNPNQLIPTDIIQMIYSYNASTNSGTYGVFTVSISGGIVTIALAVDAGNVLLPVVTGDVAVFNGTTGQIKDSNILGTNLVVKNAVNQIAAAGQILLDKGTGSVSTGAVTINKQSGVITAAVTTAAAATTSVTFNNSEIASTSVLLVSLMGGTNTTLPGPQVNCVYSSAGVATINITNNNVAGTALNGNLLIGFAIL